MQTHTTQSRDAALRQLHRINRWLIAGSVVLTGVLTDVAAHAFPGKTLKSGSLKASHSSAGGKGGARKASAATGSLQPPEQAPQASTESPSQESAPTHESVPSQESTQSGESARAQESTPAGESAPAQESTPAQESAPAQAAGESSEPVVSGGS